MAKKLGVVIARVLMGFIDGANTVQANDLVEGDAKLIKSLENGGVVDTDSAGIEYCNSIKSKTIQITGEGNSVIADAAEDDALAAADKAKKLAEEAANAKAAKINDLVADKAVLDKELLAAEEAGKADIQTKIDAIDTQIKELEAAE